MAINLKKDETAPSKTQQLLETWFTYKYWNSGCEDEAIDWLQHPLELDLKELEEFLAWREDLIQVKKAVAKCLNPMQLVKFGDIYFNI